MKETLKNITRCLQCRRHFCTDEAGTVFLPTGKHICCNHSPDTTMKKMEAIEPQEIHQIPARAHKMSQWTDAGLDRLEVALGLSKREFELSFTEVFWGRKMNISEGWTITFNQKPIPDRRHDYDFSHEDYDYCTIEGGNGLCGTGESIADCIKQIEEIEESNK